MSVVFHRVMAVTTLWNLPATAAELITRVVIFLGGVITIAEDAVTLEVFHELLGVRAGVAVIGHGAD